MSNHILNPTNPLTLNIIQLKSPFYIFIFICPLLYSTSKFPAFAQSLCHLWYHWPFHSHSLPLLLVRLIWHCSCLVLLLCIFSIFLSHNRWSLIICPPPPSCSVPQGYFLSLILFNMYTTSLSNLIAQSSLSHHLYTNEIKLFISFIPKNFTMFTIAISNLESNIASISSCITADLWTLNHSKT